MTREQAAVLENKSLSNAEKILGECRRLRLRVLTLQDADYPDRLRNIYDAPILLYGKGAMPLFDEEAAIGVVGAREPSVYGRQCAERFGLELARGGALLVSGIAEAVSRVVMAKLMFPFVGVEIMFYVEPVAWLMAWLFVLVPFYFYQKIYLVGNTDRHPENWGFLIDNDTNRWISLYPVMDFNQSFLSYDTLDGASCQPLFPAVVSQKDAAIDAVKHIGLRQIREVDMSIFGRFTQEAAMFERRLAELRKAE